MEIDYNENIKNIKLKYQVSAFIGILKIEDHNFFIFVEEVHPICFFNKAEIFEIASTKYL